MAGAAGTVCGPGVGTQAVPGLAVPSGACEPPLPAAQAACGTSCRAFTYIAREIEQIMPEVIMY